MTLCSLRKKDDKLAQSVAELAQLCKQHKQTSNELANLVGASSLGG